MNSRRPHVTRGYYLGLGVSLTLFLSLLAALPSPARASDMGNRGIMGAWIFAAGPSFPGLRMLQLENRGGHLIGTLTTDWYGPMPMGHLTVKNGTASFEITNGNPRLGIQRWSAERDGASLRVRGKIWDTQVDQEARRGTPAEVSARRFRLVALPPLAKVPANGLARTPPMGWSSWNKFADKIDDATVRQIADAMVASGLRDAGYVYVNIDDGWQGTRAKDGSLRPNSRFPDMKSLADYLHARGLKLGLYSSPGPKTCAGYTGSYGHVEQDAKTFASWGVDYLKYDLCSGEGFYLTRDQIQRAYQQMGTALRASGRPIVYSLCEYGRENVGSWGRDVGGNLWRTTGDIADNYAVMAANGFERNGRPEYAGPGGWNDPDMLEVGNGGMSHDEYVTHMTLWAMSAAPLLLGNDVRHMTRDTIELLGNREVIGVDQDPLGVQGRAVWKNGGEEIWVKALQDGALAVALFNRDPTRREIPLEPAEIGLTSIRSERDLWEDRAISADHTRFTVPAHGAVLLRITGV